jgi:hypothetical protein
MLSINEHIFRLSELIHISQITVIMIDRSSMDEEEDSADGNRGLMSLTQPEDVCPPHSDGARDGEDNDDDDAFGMGCEDDDATAEGDYDDDNAGGDTAGERNDDQGEYDLDDGAAEARDMPPSADDANDGEGDDVSGATDVAFAEAYDAADNVILAAGDGIRANNTSCASNSSLALLPPLRPCRARMTR